MDRYIHEVYKIITTCLIIIFVLIPIFHSILNAYKGQAQIYEKKSLRYEEVITP